MIVTLVRAHDTLRRFRLWLPVVLAFETVALGVLTLLARADDGYPRWALPVLIWLVFTVLFLVERRSGRSHPFALTLPLSAAQLWAAHLLALFVAGLVPLGVGVFFARLLGRVAGGAAGAAIAGPFTPLFGLEMLAGLALFIGLRELSGGETLRRTGRRASWMDLAGAVLVLLLFLAPWSQGQSALLLATAAGFTLVMAGRRLPASLLLMDTALAAPRPAPSAGAPRRELHAWLLARALLRQTAKNRFALGLGLVLMLFLGAVLSGGFAVTESLRYVLGPITVYLLFALTAGPMMKLGSLDALPVARSRMLATLLLPTFLGLTLGYGLGRAVGPRVNPSPELPRLVERADGLAVLTPPGMAEIAWDGAVPTLADGSPAPSAPLLRGLRPRLVWPYAVPAGASREFAEAQLARAEAARPVAALALPSLVLPPFAVNLLLLALFLRSFRAGISDRRRRRVFGITLAILLLGHMLPFGFLGAGLVEEEVWRDAGALVLQQIPGGVPAQWALALLLLAGAWTLALRGFERAELLPSRGSGDVCY